MVVEGSSERSVEKDEDRSHSAGLSTTARVQRMDQEPGRPCLSFTRKTITLTLR
jgi:hypothetical protein